jgi:hypothetical protein
MSIQSLKLLPNIIGNIIHIGKMEISLRDPGKPNEGRNDGSTETSPRARNEENSKILNLSSKNKDNYRHLNELKCSGS